MLKKFLYSAFAFCSLAGAAHAQEVTLKVSHFLPPSSNYQKGVLEPWCDKLLKESAGKLKCQIYPAMQLGGTPAQLVDQVKNGVADIVWTSPGYSTGRFPATEALDLPFALPPDGLGGSRAMWEYYQQYAQNDFKDYKMLALWSGMNTLIVTASKPILKLEDLKGVKLRSPSRLGSRMLQLLGATPVNMPPAQITEAISKGVIDGAMAAWDLVPSVKLEEVAKYFTEPPPNQPGFAQASLVMLMNKAKYASLPADLKTVLDRNSGLPLVEMAGRAWDQSAASGRKKAEDAGGKILIVKPEDYAVMRAAAAPVEEGWIKEVGARGLDGAKLAKGVHEISAKYLK